MRKQTKVAVVVSAAALLAMGASMTSFAKGWTLEDNEWVWLDSEDERVYGEWKKSVDGNYYWLDEETGVMATDRLVGEDDEDTYYVKGDGTRVINDWVEVENDDYAEVNGEEVDTLWYYFGSNGKAIKGTSDKPKKKDINGHTYFFDENGRMMHGRVTYGEDIYYCGTEDQGYAYKGWQYLEVEAMGYEDSEYEDEEWFYFKDGKLVAADIDEGEEFEVSYIDGKYYRFDLNGVMTTGWKDAGIASLPDGVATAPKSYANSNGAMSNGWVKVTEDDESNWYYMVTVKADDDSYKAVPFNAGGNAYRAKSIGGEIYAFDTKGKMLTGLKELDGTDGTLALEDDKDYDSVTGKYLEKGIYFFTKDGSKKGAMETGRITVTEDGEEYNYYFATDGKALTDAYIDKMIYDENGVLIKAEDGNSKEIIPISRPIYKYTKDGAKKELVIDAGSEVVVTSSGKVITSKTATVDDTKYDIVVNEGGVWEVNEKESK